MFITNVKPLETQQQQRILDIRLDDELKEQFVDDDVLDVLLALQSHSHTVGSTVLAGGVRADVVEHLDADGRGLHRDFQDARRDLSDAAVEIRGEVRGGL